MSNTYVQKSLNKSYKSSTKEVRYILNLLKCGIRNDYVYTTIDRIYIG